MYRKRQSRGVNSWPWTALLFCVSCRVVLRDLGLGGALQCRPAGQCVSRFARGPSRWALKRSFSLKFLLIFFCTYTNPHDCSELCEVDNISSNIFQRRYYSLIEKTRRKVNTRKLSRALIPVPKTIIHHVKPTTPPNSARYYKPKALFLKSNPI
jgi:hypothetical protein